MIWKQATFLFDYTVNKSSLSYYAHNIAVTAFWETIALKTCWCWQLTTCMRWLCQYCLTASTKWIRKGLRSVPATWEVAKTLVRGTVVVLFSAGKLLLKSCYFSVKHLIYSLIFLFIREYLNPLINPIHLIICLKSVCLLIKFYSS